MTVTQEDRTLDLLATIKAFISTTAGILLVLACLAIAVAFSVGAYLIGIRVGEASITFDKEAAARAAGERASLIDANKGVAKKLQETEEKLAAAQKKIKELVASERIYEIRNNETVQIAGFPTIIGMVGTAPANIATLNFENSKLEVKAGDKFTTHLGSIDACQVTVLAVDTRSVKLLAQCIDPPQK